MRASIILEAAIEFVKSCARGQRADAAAARVTCGRTPGRTASRVRQRFAFRGFAASKLTKHPENGRVCLWCSNSFEPRRSGGKQQMFCLPACRREFDVAARRWVAAAIATGVLTVDVLRNGRAPTRALVVATPSPAAPQSARVWCPPQGAATRVRGLSKSCWPGPSRRADAAEVESGFHYRTGDCGHHLVLADFPC